MRRDASVTADAQTPGREPDPIRVLIADDDDSFRLAVGAILKSESGIDVVAEVSDGEDAVRQSTLWSPHVVLMDVRMPSLGGIQAARVLSEIHPSTKVVMLSASDEDEDLLASVRAGASGYVLKSSALDGIADVVRQVCLGSAVLSPSMASKVLSEFASSARRSEGRFAQPQLTSRELQIMQDVTLGLTIDEVGRKLGIRENVVMHHIGNVVEKFHVQARIEAAFADLHTDDD